MSSINVNQLKNIITTLKNYIDKKIENSSSGSGDGSDSTSTTTDVTKEYVDNKITFDGYETIYTVTAEAITNAAQKYDSGMYRLSTQGALETLDDNAKYIIEYEGKTYNTKLVMIDDESGANFEDGALYSTDDDTRIVIMNKWDLYTTNNTSCCLKISSVDTTKITDLVIKKKVLNNLKILALSKADYDAITTKDNNTIYLVTE